MLLTQFYELSLDSERQNLPIMHSFGSYPDTSLPEFFLYIYFAVKRQLIASYNEEWMKIKDGTKSAKCIVGFFGTSKTSAHIVHMSGVSGTTCFLKLQISSDMWKKGIIQDEQIYETEHEEEQGIDIKERCEGQSCLVITCLKVENSI